MKQKKFFFQKIPIIQRHLNVHVCTSTCTCLNKYPVETIPFITYVSSTVDDNRVIYSFSYHDENSNRFISPLNKGLQK